MAEPAHQLAVAEARLAQADQALLLARIAASVVALLCFAISESAVIALARFQVMFDDIGKDAEWPLLTQLMLFSRPALFTTLPFLLGVTLFFIWSRGRRAAWLAGLGFLLMILIAALSGWAVISPLLRITWEMGNR